MYTWLVENSIDTPTLGYHPVHMTRIHVETNFDPRDNHFTSRYLEWTWELIFTSYKSWEKISVTLNLENSNSAEIQAIYGAKNYYRNVTPHLLRHFVKANNIIQIPKTAWFNDIFGDTVTQSVKTLRLTINGKIHELPEHRNIDYSFDLITTT